MSREYPDWISPERAAEGKRVFSGTVPLSRMKRLVPLLADTAGEAVFVARFGRDIENRVVIGLRVEAALPLVCQASLDVYDEHVQRKSELAVIEDDAAAVDLPEHYDAVKTEKGRLALADLVEDELLLALPAFPRKPGLKQVAYSTAGEDGRHEAVQPAPRRTTDTIRPFADLKKMIERKKQD